MSLKVYLSGEIHTAWREEIKKGAEAGNLDICFTSAVTDHAASDAAGDHLGQEMQPPMDVSILVTVVVQNRVYHHPGFLAGGGVIKINQRMAFDRLLQYREILPDGIMVQRAVASIFFV